jgi:hypothetical protein
VEVSAIPNQLDLRVHDRVALDEIDLYTDVLSAVAASDGPLTDAELDAVLGVNGELALRAVFSSAPRPRWRAAGLEPRRDSPPLRDGNRRGAAKSPRRQLIFCT